MGGRAEHRWGDEDASRGLRTRLRPGSCDAADELDQRGKAFVFGNPVSLGVDDDVEAVPWSRARRRDGWQHVASVMSVEASIFEEGTTVADSVMVLI